MLQMFLKTNIKEFSSLYCKISPYYHHMRLNPWSRLNFTLQLKGNNTIYRHWCLLSTTHHNIGMASNKDKVPMMLC